MALKRDTSSVQQSLMQFSNPFLPLFNLLQYQKFPRISGKGGEQGKDASSPRTGSFPIIDLLPTEIILMIAVHLPSSAQASFSLTCRRLFHTLPERFEELNLPAEQPFNFQHLCMSKPQIYQSKRWEFLQLLERDLSDRSFLCSDCFVLHPIDFLANSKTTLVSRLRELCRLKVDKTKSCRHLIFDGASQQPTYSPCGVVDLCPCIKLTIKKKREIEAEIRGHPDDEERRYWWHECHHVYDCVKLRIRIRVSLYKDTGELGVILEYHHTRPSDLFALFPRLSCPHRNLDTLIQSLLQCSGLHPNDFCCRFCQDHRQCKDCHTTVLKFQKDSSFTRSTDSYWLWIERRLDDQTWCQQTVYPWARLRTLSGRT